MIYDLRVTSSNYASGEWPSCNQETTWWSKSSLTGRGSGKSATTENRKKEHPEIHARRQLSGTSNLVTLTLWGAKPMLRVHELFIVHNQVQEAYTIRFQENSITPCASGSILVGSESSPPPPHTSSLIRHLSEGFN